MSLSHPLRNAAQRRTMPRQAALRCGRHAALRSRRIAPRVAQSPASHWLIMLVQGSRWAGRNYTGSPGAWAIARYCVSHCGACSTDQVVPARSSRLPCLALVPHSMRPCLVQFAKSLGCSSSGVMRLSLWTAPHCAGPARRKKVAWANQAGARLICSEAAGAGSPPLVDLSGHAPWIQEWLHPTVSAPAQSSNEKTASQVRWRFFQEQRAARFCVRDGGSSG